MSLNRFPIYLLFAIFAIACAPAVTTDQTAENSAETVTTADADDHSEDEHHEDDQSDAHSEDEHTEDGDADAHDHDEDEDSHRERGVHEHGAAELLIAISDNQIAIELETPAFIYSALNTHQHQKKS